MKKTPCEREKAVTGEKMRAPDKDTAVSRDPTVAAKRRFKLDYIAIKYIGIAFMTVSQLIGYFALRIAADPDASGGALYAFLNTVRNIGVLTMPLLLTAMTSAFTVNGAKIRRTVLQNLLLAVFFYCAEILLFLNFVVPFANELIKELIEIEIDATVLLTELLGQFANINIFIDLFLCSLLYLFFVYTPRSRRVPLRVWRAATLLPVAFIAASFIINGLTRTGVMNFNVYIGALFPHKYAVTYVFFFVSLAYIKYKPRVYGLFGRPNLTDRMTYFYGDADAKRYNAFLISLIGILSLVDLAPSFIPAAAAWGIGRSYFLFTAAPLLVFFDYRQKPRRKLAVWLLPLYYAANFILIGSLYVQF